MLSLLQERTSFVECPSRPIGLRQRRESPPQSRHQQPIGRRCSAKTTSCSGQSFNSFVLFSGLVAYVVITIFKWTAKGRATFRGQTSRRISKFCCHFFFFFFFFALMENEIKSCRNIWRDEAIAHGIGIPSFAFAFHCIRFHFHHLLLFLLE